MIKKEVMKEDFSVHLIQKVGAEKRSGAQLVMKRGDENF
jgi:hypothetical protein